MRRTALTSALAAAAIFAACGEESSRPPSAQIGAGGAEASTVGARDGTALRYTMTRLDGREDDLSRYKGNVVLVVNTATQCGFTPQFEGLQSLYEEYRADGFVVLGFPSNDFAGQEPRTEKEIGEFCRANYGVSFPMFSKTKVTGEDKHPFFADLGEPDWNFNKYLLNRSGRLVERWGADAQPTGEIEATVSQLL